jgi:hypothetical protein
MLDTLFHQDADKVSIGSRAALRAAVPRLLLFHPEWSIVIVGLRGGNEAVITIRADLPLPDDRDGAHDLAHYAASRLGQHHLEAAAAVGYGSSELVTPVAEVIRDHLADRGIELKKCLRAHDGRYWSCLGDSCPSEGIPYGPNDDPANEALATAKPILASRRVLAATLAPVSGADTESMNVATRKAYEQVVRMVSQAQRTGRSDVSGRVIVNGGIGAVKIAVASYRDGGEFSHNAAAWLSVVLQSQRVRDDAWARMDPEHKEAHLRLWTDVTRLARPGYVAPAASPAGLCRLAGRQRAPRQRRARPGAERRPVVLDGPPAPEGA